VLVTSIEYYLKRASPKGRVVLRAVGSGEEAILEIAAESAPPLEVTEKVETDAGPLPPELAGLEPILGSLGARIAFADSAAGTELHLILPSRKSEDR